MKPGHLVQLGLLLARLTRPPATDGGHRDVLEQPDQTTPEGAGYDLYLPRSRRATARVVALHGMTVNHRRDLRLIHFARTLARAGLACVTPTLPGLRDGRFDPGDLAILRSVLRQQVAADTGPPGLIGFSFGGAQALIVGAEPGLAERLRFVVAFGAYHSLAELIAHFRHQEGLVPTSAAGWDNAVYLGLFLARRLRARGLVPWSPAVWDQAESLLGRSCYAASLEEKRTFYLRHLQGLRLVEPASQELSPAALAALSPAGQLAGLRCPVSLIHDEHDTLVPPDHARRLHAELLTRPAALAVPPTLLVTPLLSHVSLSEALRLADVWQLCVALEPVAAALE